MIDPFTALLGVLTAVALLGLGISLLDPWREDCDRCAEMLRVRSTVTDAIADGLDDSYEWIDPAQPWRPPGWTNADELRSIRAIFEEECTECSSSEQR